MESSDEIAQGAIRESFFVTGKTRTPFKLKGHNSAKKSFNRKTCLI
jgi:hypothetical protein